LLTLRWEEQQRQRDMPLALLVQMALNDHRDPQQRREPFTWEEVMGFLGHRLPPATPPPPPDVEALRQQLDLLHEVYGMGQTGLLLSHEAIGPCYVRSG